MDYCFVVPNYNHIHRIEEVLQELVPFGLPILMVNDASHSDAKELFDRLEKALDLLTVVHHQENQGKGGAVQTGIKKAAENGYQYVIQVDADGQHCLDDLQSLIALSKAHPKELISGKPVYDESIPKHRYWARYITHVWVHIETLSLQLKDTMCGFRVYPVEPCMALFEDAQLGKRMDFDTEVLVRLYWRGVPTRFMDTRVIYPEDGVSHFRPLDDNLRISWMHTRLFLGMLPRSPSLIWRNLKRWLK